MKKRSALQFLTILIIILTACSGYTATPISDEDAIATAVATMLSGIPTNTPPLEPTVTSTPEPQTLLPRSLYYLAQDANGKAQIYRLSRDGVAITQIASEADGILNFDISPVDGTLVYPVQNSLIAISANGENRRMLVQDSNIYFSVTWSPDGSSIVYGNKDVMLYSLATGKSEILITGSDTETNSPVSFSPNGKKLLIKKTISPSAPGAGQLFIYDFASQALTAITVKSCNGSGISWVDPDTLFCNNYVFAGPGFPGLWQVDAVDGSGIPLVFSASCPPCLPVAAPRQNVDGTLYYLYGEVNDINNLIYPPLSLVHSASDGVTDRVFIRPESFVAVSTLWTLDGKALLIIQSKGTNADPKDMILVPINPSLPIKTIMADASAVSAYSLRWGP